MHRRQTPVPFHHGMPTTVGELGLQHLTLLRSTATLPKSLTFIAPGPAKTLGRCRYEQKCSVKTVLKNLTFDYIRRVRCCVAATDADSRKTSLFRIDHKFLYYFNDLQKTHRALLQEIGPRKISP
jgi:hypothetical protein